MSAHSPIINKRHRLSLGFCVWLILTASVIAVGGVDYALVTNEHATIKTEIEKLRRATADARMTANDYKGKSSLLTDRWALRDRLSQSDTDLSPIQREQIETMESDLYLPLDAGIQPDQQLTLSKTRRGSTQAQ